MSSPTPYRPGLSGRIASLFIGSKLTPLLLLAALLLGVLAVILTPREEEPQIVVPMADVFLPFPGASANVVEEQLTKPIERVLSEIRGVEYLYSISRPGGALLIVRFYVGEPMERSLVNLYDKLMSNQDRLPPGAGPFHVKPRDINDVPIVTLTLSSDRYADAQLRQVAEGVLEEIKKVPSTAGGFLVGGRPRELRVQLDAARLNAYGVSPLRIVEVIRGEHVASSAGRFSSGNQDYLLETGRFLRSREDLEALVVGLSERHPVYLRQVAEVIDGPAETTQYVWFGDGPSGTRFGQDLAATDAAGASPSASRFTLHESPAVTVAIAKQPGANAVTVSRAVLRTVNELKGRLIPADVRVTVTRDYGESADEKANELLWHLAIAVVAVVIFLGVTLGPRPAMVVSLAIPITLALTLLCPDFLDRHSGRRCHRRRRKHLSPPHAPTAPSPGCLDLRGGRSGESHDPGHLYRHCGPPPDGLRVGAHGSLYAAHSHQCLDRHVCLVTGRLHRGALVLSAVLSGRDDLGRAGRVGGAAGAGQPPLPAGAHPAPRPTVAGLDVFRVCRALAGRIGVAVRHAGRAGQDAALRRQERASTRDRYAEGHHAGRDGSRRKGAHRLCADDSGSPGLPGLCRHGLAGQLQRAGATLLPARGASSGRHSDQSGRQGSTDVTEPRDRPANPTGGSTPRLDVGRQREGGGSAAGSTRAGRGGRGGLRPRLRAAA
ncbi:MAG: efflux RND transporter permease subunit [Nitrospira sp.]|nr:MAG: efflux RND transporter permease subunit [Nitrospira sp.]